MAKEDIKETDEPAANNEAAPKSDLLQVKIYAPFQVYFEGQATSVSAENATGPFDILPKHRNFICMLLPCVIRVASTKGSKEVKVNRALMHVESNNVVVFVDV